MNFAIMLFKCYLKIKLGIHSLNTEKFTGHEMNDVPDIHDTWDEYVLDNQFGVTQLVRPNAYIPIWKAHMCNARWGPRELGLALGWENNEVELLPPALARTDLASSVMK